MRMSTWNQIYDVEYVKYGASTMYELITMRPFEETRDLMFATKILQKNKVKLE